MKALSFTQPWLWAILHGGKRIENRVAWKGCSYRGPILLHAAKSVGTRHDFDETVMSIREILGSEEISAPAAARLVPRFLDECVDRNAFSPVLPHICVPSPALLRGGIVGRARISGVIRDEESFAGYVKLGGDRGQRAWWFGGFALVLDDVEPLPFVPWKGALGLFEVPDDYATVTP